MADYKLHYMHWAKDNADAVALIEMFGALQHIADDFIDEDMGDMARRSDLMTRMLHICLVDIPLNSFYQKHNVWLMPVISSVLVQVNAADHWYDADQEEVRTYSFVWRTAAEQLVYQIAYICGGLKHAQKVAREYREVWLQDEDHSRELWEKEHVLAG